MSTYKYKKDKPAYFFWPRSCWGFCDVGAAFPPRSRVGNVWAMGVSLGGLSRTAAEEALLLRRSRSA